MQTTGQKPTYASMVKKAVAKPANAAVVAQAIPAQPSTLTRAKVAAKPIAKPTGPAVAGQPSAVKPGRMTYAAIVATGKAEPAKPAMAIPSGAPTSAEQANIQKISRWSNKSRAGNRHSTRAGRPQEIPEAVLSKIEKITGCKSAANEPRSPQKGAAPPNPAPAQSATLSATEIPKAASTDSCLNSAPSSDSGSSKSACLPPTRRMSYASVASMPKPPLPPIPAPAVGPSPVKQAARAAAMPAGDRKSVAKEAVGVRNPGAKKGGIANITDLLSAVKNASSSSIMALLRQLDFKPQTDDFNRMLHQSFGDVGKAIQLWRVMKTTPNVHPDDKSFQYLILALLRAKQFNQAISRYKEMKAYGIFGDPQFYNNVMLQGLRSGMPLEAVLLICKDMHLQEIYASPDVYCMALNRVSDERGWQKAEELFLCSVMVEHIIPTRVCLALMKIYSKAGATRQTAQLLQEFLSQEYSQEDKFQMAFAALETYVSCDCHQRAVELWRTYFKSESTSKARAAKLVLKAVQEGGCNDSSYAALTQELMRTIKEDMKRENGSRNQSYNKKKPR